MQDLMEWTLYSYTTICGGRFVFGTLIMVDTRATLGTGRMDKYGKFHVITDVMEAACSGSTRVIDLSLEVLRDTAAELERDGQEVTHDLLLHGLRNSEKLRGVLWHLKRKAGPGDEVESATVLLVSRAGEDDRAVCKILIEDPIKHSFSRLQASGSGYDNPDVKHILDSLPYDAPIEDVVSRVVAGFEEATKRDRKTGGHLIILRSDHGGPWTVYKDHTLPDYDDWDT